MAHPGSEVMLNPYLLLGGVLLWLASLVGVGTWQHTEGVAEQKVEDQREFDRINAAITKQKSEATAKYSAKQAEVIAVMAERDQFKNQVEKERNEHRIETDALRARYAGLGLRFRPAEGAGPGAGGGSAASPPGNPAGAVAPAVVQLPDAVARNLRQLVFDADRLRDEYAACYAYANGPVK
jgi:hypothetical protein